MKKINIICTGIVILAIIHSFYKDIYLRINNGCGFDWDMVCNVLFITVFGVLLIPQKYGKFKQKILWVLVGMYFVAMIFAIKG